MIDRQRGNLVFECDMCPETLETEQPDFATAWRVAEREGWERSKIGNDWLHACQTCGKP